MSCSRLDRLAYGGSGGSELPLFRMHMYLTQSYNCHSRPFYSCSVTPTPLRNTLGPLQPSTFWRQTCYCPAEHFKHILRDLNDYWV